MSFASTINTFSHINNILGSTVNYADEKQRGASTSQAVTNFGLNVMGGAIRNEMAYDMRKHYGSNMGFIVNGLAGYGNQESNYRGTVGLLGTGMMLDMMHSPFGGFGGCGMYGGSIFGGGMFGGSYFGGGFMGGGMCGGSVFGGSMFGNPFMMGNRFFC